MVSIQEYQHLYTIILHATRPPAWIYRVLLLQARSLWQHKLIRGLVRCPQNLNCPLYQASNLDFFLCHLVDLLWSEPTGKCRVWPSTPVESAIDNFECTIEFCMDRTPKRYLPSQIRDMSAIPDATGTRTWGHTKHALSETLLTVLSTTTFFFLRHSPSYQ